MVAFYLKNMRPTLKLLFRCRFVKNSDSSFWKFLSCKPTFQEHVESTCYLCKKFFVMRNIYGPIFVQNNSKQDEVAWVVGCDITKKLFQQCFPCFFWNVTPFAFPCSHTGSMQLKIFAIWIFGENPFNILLDIECLRVSDSKPCKNAVPAIFIGRKSRIINIEQIHLLDSPQKKRESGGTMSIILQKGSITQLYS